MSFARTQRLPYHADLRLFPVCVLGCPCPTNSKKIVMMTGSAGSGAASPKDVFRKVTQRRHARSAPDRLSLESDISRLRILSSKSLIHSWEASFNFTAFGDAGQSRRMLRRAEANLLLWPAFGATVDELGRRSRGSAVL